MFFKTQANCLPLLCIKPKAQEDYEHRLKEEMDAKNQKELEIEKLVRLPMRVLEAMCFGALSGLF